MYEEYFSRFSYVDVNSPFCVVRLNDPFAGVEVLLAKTFQITPDGQIKFDYDVTGVPDDFDKSQIATLEFTDLVKNIFMAILEEQVSEYAETDNDQGQTPEGSIPAGPGTEGEGK
jgi:hypothetical protein